MGVGSDVIEIAGAFEAGCRAVRAAERTAAIFSVWRAGELTQAAVAWLRVCALHQGQPADRRANDYDRLYRWSARRGKEVPIARIQEVSW